MKPLEEFSNQYASLKSVITEDELRDLDKLEDVMVEFHEDGVTAFLGYHSGLLFTLKRQSQGGPGGTNVFQVVHTAFECVRCRAVVENQEAFFMPNYKRTASDLPLQNEGYNLCEGCCKEYITEPALDCPGIFQCPLVRENWPEGVQVSLTGTEEKFEPGDVISVPAGLLEKLGGRPGEIMEVNIELSTSDRQFGRKHAEVLERLKKRFTDV